MKNTIRRLEKLVHCDCSGILKFEDEKEIYKCEVCGKERKNFEVIPESEIIIPPGKSRAWRLKRYSIIDKKIKKILGKSSERINTSAFHYANPGKRFHFDVLAKDEEDLRQIIKENWQKLKQIMELFGEKLIDIKYKGEE